MNRLEALSQTFQAIYGHPPAGVWAAPGRVNLIGEHTDYNHGYVMPFALGQQTLVACSARTDGRWSAYSSLTGQAATFTAEELIPGMTGWQTYVAGIVWALRQAGYDIGGAEFAVDSSVPVGAGLSSSAALECAVLTALVELYDVELGGMQQALLARQCENEFARAPTGVMDQAASILCERDHALFLDCKTLDFERVPLRLAATGWELLVLDTNTPHEHVGGAYADRRRACEAAAQTLGISTLRDVDDVDTALTRLTGPVLRRRVRHVVTENRRVLQAREVLAADRIDELGPILDASHRSMRDDFEITVPTVDLAAETARDAGAAGARMTGGGFGGCVIALVASGAATEIFARVEQAFAGAGFDAPQRYPAQPSQGARRLSG
jgi:galactokinase